MDDRPKQERERRKPLDLRARLLLLLIIIGVVALGLFGVNQFLSYQFKAQFLGSPCDLCVKINPHLENCLTNPVQVNPYNIKINNNNNKINFTLPLLE